jgi:hypothetical protein
MIVRQEAAQACIDRFNGKPMKWGKVDCWQITAHNLRKLGLSTALTKGLTYDGEIGAVKAMRSLGFKTLGALVDAHDVFRIPPAMAGQGDLIGMACEGEVWDMALTVGISNGRVFGILDGKAGVMQPDMTHAVMAWRCNPCRR